MNAEDITRKILEKLRPYEFRSFVIGFERPEGYTRPSHEGVFRALKVAIGDEITRRLQGVDVNFDHPDIRVDVFSDGDIRLQLAPVFLGGRYRKHSRKIPSSRWIHHFCRGRGCSDCGFTGNLCGPSVEELLSSPVLELSGGDRALFHALGREDTDARMLGTGRPFVLEVHAPVRRTLPLVEIEARFAAEAGELAEVFSLASVDRSAVAAVKQSAAEKTYRAWVAPAGRLPDDAERRARSLAGVTVDQKSPRRVMHRKGRDTHRLKKILESTWVGNIGGLWAWEVRVDSGTYVKELVTGDEGRTRPSLSELLGVECACHSLDVLQVHWDPPWESR